MGLDQVPDSSGTLPEIDELFVVLVISAGKTRRDETRQAISNLKQSGATILGAVLNRSTEMSSSYGYGADEERGKLRRFRPMLKSLSMRLRLIGQGD